MMLKEQEPPQPPHTTLKDPRVNLRLGTGGFQAKVDTAPKVPPPAPSTMPFLPLLLTQALLGDEKAKAERLRLLGNVPS